jgi:hypothetical protein
LHELILRDPSGVVEVWHGELLPNFICGLYDLGQGCVRAIKEPEGTGTPKEGKHQGCILFVYLSGEERM